MLHGLGRASAALSFVLLWTTIAGAQASASTSSPALRRAEARYEEADFDGALEALEEAEHGTSLTLTDLARLYEMRALVYLGLSNQSGATTAVRSLLAVRADYQVPARSSPAFARLVRSVPVPQGIALDVQVSTGPGRAQIDVQVTDDAALVREIRIHTRPLGETSYATHVGASYNFRAPAGVTGFDLYVDLIGPGGAVLASDHNDASPSSFTLPASSVVTEPPVEQPAQGGDDNTWLIVGLIAGGVLVAGGVVAAIVIVGNQQPDTILGPPQVVPLVQSSQSAPLFRF